MAEEREEHSDVNVVRTYRMTKQEWAEVREWFGESHWQDAPELGPDVIVVTFSGHPGMHANLGNRFGRKALTSEELAGIELRHPLVGFVV